MSLTKDIKNAGESEKEEHTSTLEALIKACDFILSDKNIDQKTHLSEENILGIIVGLTHNDYLESKFNFRLHSLDSIVTEKMFKNISLDRKGRNEIIEMFRAMKFELEGSDVQTMGSRVIYGKR